MHTLTYHAKLQQCLKYNPFPKNSLQRIHYNRQAMDVVWDLFIDRFNLVRKRRIPMAKRKTYDNNSVLWVNKSLTSQEKKQCEVWWNEHGDDMFVMLDQLMYSGYKLYPKATMENEAVSISVLQSDDKAKDANRGVGTVGRDFEHALSMALFKMYVLWDNTGIPEPADGEERDFG